MKRSQRRDFLTVVLFFGILVSFLLYLGIGTLVAGEKPIGEKSGEGKSRTVGFNAVFYEDEFLSKVGQFVDLRIFHHVDHTNILVGRGDWLFEIYDADTDYNYLLDYVGGCPYSEEEMKQISRTVAERQQALSAIGTEYRLVVIPNSMTVCEDSVPRFVGRQSADTRLCHLTAYLEREGINCFLSPVERMLADTEQMGALYQNTEDAINAYGAYSLYALLCENLGCENATPYDQIEFFVHMTEGREVAKLADLQDVVPNRTVSVSDDMMNQYEIITEEHCLRSEMIDSAAGSDEVLMLCFSRSWDRIQLTPFFSGTYDTVYYRDGGASLEEVEKHSPSILVEFIHESELSLLLKR